jgi:transcriptional regulator with GAF, ATPase, and Fis domain
MLLDDDYQPEFESFTHRLLELAQIRSVQHLLRQVVTLLTNRPHVAVARIWLIDEGDLCSSCPLLGRCKNRASCLHLVASAGKRQSSETPNWTRLDDEYQRIPLGLGKIGTVGSVGEAIVVTNFSEDATWLERHPWAIEERILGFNAQPIRFKDAILGVLAVFTNIPTPDEGRSWLRILADHIAVAMTNAQAFEEIERLRAQVEAENVYLQEEVREAKAFGEIIGRSLPMLQVLRQLEMVAPTDATVLVLGESGTGKELVAREIHQRSRRREHPLIRVNCASVPRDLYESEFFGHVKGAFTGAIKDRSGRFEAAHQGTLFLDEVGEIPLELQSKFLRVLQERQYERVGDERTRKVDVRLIAATNRDLKKEVEEGRFRQDLYYRLNVFPIEVPPLRERKEDIPVLTEHFLEHSAQRLHLPARRLTEAHARLLMSYDWPGNVRELQNAVDRALILAQNGALHFDIPVTQVETVPSRGEGPTIDPESAAVILTEAEVRQWEAQNTLAALTKAGWKIHGEGGAAALLGLKPTTLLSRIKKLNLKKPD